MSDGRQDASERPNRDVRWAALLTLIGAALLVLGMTHRSDAGDVPVGVLDLHNDSAESGKCDTDAGASWHFVIAPNDDEYAFVSISLTVAGTLHTYAIADVTLNHGQQDNVFVPIPAGLAATDLSADGSFA